jgi:ribosomal protein S18 acetylase RimI-like enzyme
MAQSVPQTIEIRRALVADVADVRALTRAAYAKWVPIIGREPLPMIADYERAVAEHRIDLLFARTQLAGLIETASKEDHLLIVNVAVAPTWQGRGHGRRLLGHAEGLAGSIRLPELRLYTNKLFAANVAFYRSLGYVIDREEAFMGGVTVHMSKRLAVG